MKKTLRSELFRPNANLAQICAGAALFLTMSGLSPAPAHAQQPADPLSSSFVHPPASAKPQVWWHWVNGNVSKPGITADLEAMKSAGIGGGTICSLGDYAPEGPAHFNSDLWWDDIKFAMSEAGRLGLELGVENCEGWSSSGGPWVKPEDAMKMLVWSEAHVTGAAQTTIHLPQPPTRHGFYRDTTVVAFPAIATEAGPKKVVAVLQSGEAITVTGDGLKPVTSGLVAKGNPKTQIRPGAVIRLIRGSANNGKPGEWSITQLPEVEGAFVAIDPRTGAVRAMVGGFDFAKNKFNHVTQAWRQPGSAFKPFVYSAALEKGFTPATVINDAPLFFDAGSTGSQPWEPKNYDGKFEGPMTMRRGLEKSKNMISIRILQSIGAPYAQKWITRFGFEADKHPAYLPMALGTGSVTPLQMASAYSVFASGGYRLNPMLISKITDHKGRVLNAAVPPVLNESMRTLDARNAYVMDTLLNTVALRGTAAAARRALNRPDIYGKTGTTNDSIDTWFAGFQPSLVAIVWVGYDSPRKLGDNETGGGLSLPIWIEYMKHALNGMPVEQYPVPEGVVNVGDEWFYEEYTKGAGVASVGLDDKLQTAPDEEERKSILDLFKR